MASIFKVRKPLLMMTFLVIGPIFLNACATKHEDRVEHHHHPEIAFEGKCAYSVANKIYDVPGNPDFQLEHRGIIYYFSSQELLDKFKDHVDANVRRGKLNWGFP